MTSIRPTSEYNAFQDAYDYFNEVLFAGELPNCMITLQRKPKAGGYFSPERFVSRNGDERTDEIALNPDYFYDYDDAYILSILVHEMAHLWQQHFDKPSRNGYHNKRWAAKMHDVGLQPVSRDNPGKETGQAVSHEIKVGDVFDNACKALLDDGFALNWQSATYAYSSRPLGGQNGDGAEGEDGEVKPKKDRSKVRFTCPNCKVNAWGKESLHLVCGDCDETMEAQS